MMTDAEVEAAALADPDAQPLADAQLKSARRVGLHGTLRQKLKLSRAEFAARYHIPIEAVRAWEQGTLQPDAVAEALLHLISVDPEGVAGELSHLAAAE
jgi:putative transcriptional regulator